MCTEWPRTLRATGSPIDSGDLFGEPQFGKEGHIAGSDRDTRSNFGIEVRRTLVYVDRDVFLEREGAGQRQAADSPAAKLKSASNHNAQDIDGLPDSHSKPRTSGCRHAVEVSSCLSCRPDRLI